MYYIIHIIDKYMYYICYMQLSIKTGATWDYWHCFRLPSENFIVFNYHYYIVNTVNLLLYLTKSQDLNCDAVTGSFVCVVYLCSSSPWFL
jgi:hypothetical protein